MMKKEIKKTEDMVAIEEILLSREDDSTRPAADFVDLPAGTLVEFFDTRSRWTGTGYKDYIYRIVGTDDALVVYANMHHQEGFYDSVEVEPGYFARQRDYGRRCRAAAKAVGAPIELALAVGPERVGPFVAHIQNLSASGRTLTRKEIHELYCGIDRRKAAIEKILKGGGFEGLSYGMGQTNSTRVAEYLVDTLRPNAGWEQHMTTGEACTTRLGGLIKAAGF